METYIGGFNLFFPLHLSLFDGHDKKKRKKSERNWMIGLIDWSSENKLLHSLYYENEKDNEVFSKLNKCKFFFEAHEHGWLFYSAIISFHFHSIDNDYCRMELNSTISIELEKNENRSAIWSRFIILEIIIKYEDNEWIYLRKWKN